MGANVLFVTRYAIIARIAAAIIINGPTAEPLSIARFLATLHSSDGPIAEPRDKPHKSQRP
ncbi:hypothetical protein ACCT32_35745, partial [Rhizobium brockwellii]|uniref:hypothetical protein n=1 Tax=Rhizobium brockwellii TaxID=3019932 RepID=UPI003F9BBCD0